MYTRSRYKQCSPQETVSKIKSILSSIDLQVEEERFHNSGGIDSCRITISNKGLKYFDIGTNGKGMTKDYARASAYAEFMERLQNKTLFRDGLKYASPYLRDIISNEFLRKLSSNGLLLDFLYFPDEKIVSSIIKAPFIELISEKEEMFPIGLYRAMCGSTGLCAGNSCEEAICQGLNEIMERFVLWKLFDEQIVPQYIIPLETFANNDIYYKLSALEDNYDIVIHNWAAHFEGVPVIGLLLSRKNDGAYTYRLGADFNAVTALERCYTEIFQGKNALKCLLKSKDKNHQSTIDDYYLCRHNGTGIFPYSLTCVHPDAKIVEYPHHDFISYKDELSYYKKFLKSRNKELYIKDNSFLNFPAYSIYIPGMSNPSYSNINLYKELESMKINEYTYIEGRYDLKRTLYNRSHEPISSHRIEDPIIRLNPWNSSSNNNFYYQLAEALRFIALRQWKNAAYCIDLLMNYLKSIGSIEVSPIFNTYKRLYTILCNTAEYGMLANISKNDNDDL